VSIQLGVETSLPSVEIEGRPVWLTVTHWLVAKSNFLKDAAAGVPALVTYHVGVISRNTVAVVNAEPCTGTVIELANWTACDVAIVPVPPEQPVKLVAVMPV
jgi:hypothetical protein